jgi:NAD(P)H-dependent FMN reductase
MISKILAFGGSNSRSSINKELATYVANQTKDTVVTVVDLNDYELPIYSPDLEKESGIPKAVNDFWNVISSSDGIVLSLAEYNGSYTAAFKNLFDWLSRIDMKVWQDKPMLIMATSPGGRGGAGVLHSALTAFPHLGGNIVADFSLPKFQDNFQKGEIINQKKQSELEEKLKLFQLSLVK